MKTSKKTQSRHYAFKFLFQFQSQQSIPSDIALNELDNILEEFDQTYVEPDREHPDNVIDHEIKNYAAKLIRLVLTHEDEIKNKISPLLTKGGIDDVNMVNRLAVILGTTELLYCADIPAKVVINESINLAKEYGTKESHTFVNSILDRISKGE